jgi:hypothetical protein
METLSIKCAKRRYNDEKEAKEALAEIKARKSKIRHRKERRLYECPSCKGYHLTSQRLLKGGMRDS